MATVCVSYGLLQGQVLLAHGADVDIKYAADDTAQDVARHRGHRQCRELLEVRQALLNWLWEAQIKMPCTVRDMKKVQMCVCGRSVLLPVGMRATLQMQGPSRTRTAHLCINMCSTVRRQQWQQQPQWQLRQQ